MPEAREGGELKLSQWLLLPFFASLAWKQRRLIRVNLFSERGNEKNVLKAVSAIKLSEYRYMISYKQQEAIQSPTLPSILPAIQPPIPTLGLCFNFVSTRINEETSTERKERNTTPHTCPSFILSTEAATTHSRSTTTEAPIRARAKLIASRGFDGVLLVQAHTLGGRGGHDHGEDADEQSLGDGGELHGGCFNERSIGGGGGFVRMLKTRPSFESERRKRDLLYG